LPEQLIAAQQQLLLKYLKVPRTLNDKSKPTLKMSNSELKSSSGNLRRHSSAPSSFSAIQKATKESTITPR